MEKVWALCAGEHSAERPGPVFGFSFLLFPEAGFLLVLEHSVDQAVLELAGYTELTAAASSSAVTDGAGHHPVLAQAGCGGNEV